MFDFEPFEKIARLRRELVITEKLDGTNAQVYIVEVDDKSDVEGCIQDPYCIDVMGGYAPGKVLAMFAGSRKRWIAPEGTTSLDKGCDNFGFAKWVQDNARELFNLGPGRHFGEWYGRGIQRGYGLEERRFALFNTARWGAHNPYTPECCDVVPQIPSGTDPEDAMRHLALHGSVAVPGFMHPEGIVVYHTASRTLYKQTFDQDGGKWRAS